MDYPVHLFGPARDRVGADQVGVRVEAGEVTARRLLKALTEQHPALASLIPYARLACNQEFCTPDSPVGPQDELALIPPVAGG